MPLLYKKTFKRNDLPEDLKDSEEVFYCELTNEIFRDYEEFCERIILCNSLVWACSLSGRANLTYQEALASEENAKSMLNEFPMELRIPVLYLTTLTQRKSLNELAEDVYCFAKDRYFMGENVEVDIPGSSLFTESLPSHHETSIAHCQQISASSCSPLSPSCYLPPFSFTDPPSGLCTDITSCIVKRVIEPTQESLDSFKKQTPKNGERQYWPPSSFYRYEVVPVDNEKSKSSTIVSADLIHRKKTFYSRAKNRLYIKQFTEQVDGLWKLKATTAEKYGISKVKFNLIFVGEAPDLSPTKKTSPNQNKTNSSGKKRQECIDKYFTKKSPSKQQSSQPTELTESQQKSLIQKLKEKYKSQNANNSNKNDPFRQKRKYNKKNLLQSADKNAVLTETEIKQKKQEEKLKLRELKRKKKEQVALMMKEYNRKKEDLELEDLQDLPEPMPVELRLPNELFGDFAMALEFINTFQDVINMKDYFPSGVTIEILERALVESEVQGPLYDIFEMLLLAIFQLQEEEDDEIREDSDLKTADWQDMADVAGDEFTKEAVRQATIAARWAQAYHRTPLGKLTLDASTVSEVLRLHLLASGGRCGDSSAKWRYQQRGGYSSLDDPGLILRLTQPHILDALSITPFCDLPIVDKLSILTCLLNQILTFSAIRDVIDERMEKIKQGKVELRSLHGNDRRRELEALQKVKDGEWTVEQLEKEKELLHRRKQDQCRREKELKDENLCNQVLPLGVDRAYRRYWMFSALPGLFVEHDEQHAGPCLPKGTPVLNLGMLNGEDPEIYIKRLFQEGSKENLVTTPMKCQTTPSKTPTKTPVKTPTKGTPNKKIKLEQAERRPWTCWADPTSCPVHSTHAPRVCWSFFKSEDDVNALISTLNKRGIRENVLQATLEEEKDRVIQSIGKCPMSRLNPKLFPTDETRKSLRNNPKYDNANLNFPPETPSEEILESILRDLILETEQKINDGCLGSLKIRDRIAWREALLNKTYDQQCDRLSWGGSSKNIGETNGDIADDDENQSRPSTPSSETSFRDLQLDSKVEQRSKVRELASAILQIEQSIDHKYLRRPLGKGVDKKDNNVKGEQLAQIARIRWETSLMASTSISQLFLHFTTLDTSITWARSILKAYCRLCRRKGDPEKMLLCDNCNKGHHTYCLKPKLTNVPRGDWFCAKCKPREKFSPVKKNRRIFTEESDDEDEKENESKALPVGVCKMCRAKGPMIVCEQCDDGFHFECVQPPLRKVPSGNWYCQKCRRGSSTTTAATNKKDETSPLSDGERTSRRRSSKAATAKISQFAKQLRTNSWEGESEPGASVEASVREGSRRRSRRSLETEMTANSSPTISKHLPLDNATLQELLDQLMHHEDAWPFLRPVTKADVEDYHKIIKRPMDFGTIKHKLNMLEYRTNGEVLSDSLLVFENCYSYNKDDTEVYQCGVRLHEVFEKLCRDRGLKPRNSEDQGPAPKKSRTAI